MTAWALAPPQAVSRRAADGPRPVTVGLDLPILALHKGDEGALKRYSTDCLPRIWRAQEFSHWMINLLHGPPGDDEESVYLRALQHARLDSLRTSRSHQDHFAENYVGI